MKLLHSTLHMWQNFFNHNPLPIRVTCLRILELKWSLQVCNRSISCCTHTNTQFLTILVMIHYTYEYLVCGHCPSSCSLKRTQCSQFQVKKVRRHQLTWVWQKDQFCLCHQGVDTGDIVGLWNIGGLEHSDATVNLRRFIQLCHHTSFKTYNDSKSYCDHWTTYDSQLHPYMHLWSGFVKREIWLYYF